jgi:hypothetical protein
MVDQPLREDGLASAHAEKHEVTGARSREATREVFGQTAT